MYFCPFLCPLLVNHNSITIGGKLIKDHLEAVGHADAYDFLYTLAKNQKITEEDILKLHKLFYYRLDVHGAGVYRKKQVFITGTDFVPPTYADVSKLMEQFVDELPELKKKYHPVEYAALIHLRLVTIHPFEDGNGRTVRLLMNLALMQAGYTITIIPPIVRRDYIDSIKEYQLKNHATPFVNFISNMVYESLADYIRMVKRLEE